MMEKGNTVVTIRIPQKDYEWLQAQAKENDTSPNMYASCIIRQVVNRYREYEKNMEEWYNA